MGFAYYVGMAEFAAEPIDLSSDRGRTLLYLLRRQRKVLAHVDPASAEQARAEATSLAHRAPDQPMARDELYALARTHRITAPMLDALLDPSARRAQPEHPARVTVTGPERAQLAAFVRARREQAGLDQFVLAHISGVDVSNVTNLERTGSRTIGLERFHAIADVLGFTAADLAEAVPSLHPRVRNALCPAADTIRGSDELHLAHSPLDEVPSEGQRERRIFLRLDDTDLQALANTFNAALGDAPVHHVARGVGLQMTRVAPLFGTARYPKRNAFTVHVVAEHLGIDDETLTAGLTAEGADRVREDLATLRRYLTIAPDTYTPRPVKSPASATPREARVDMPRRHRDQLGLLVRRTREAQGVSVAELAEAVDVPGQWIRTLENSGSGTVWRDRFRAVADALAIDPATIEREIPNLDHTTVDRLFGGNPFGPVTLIDASDRISVAHHTKVSISALLVQTREARHLDADAIADAAGISSVALHHLEDPSIRTVSFTRLRAALDALGIGSNELGAAHLSIDDATRTIAFRGTESFPMPELPNPLVIDDETMRMLPPKVQRAVVGAIVARGLTHSAGVEFPSR